MLKEFDKIIGYSTEKKELEMIADILKNTDEYLKLGITTPRGILFYGQPGVGKTLMANCLIAASGRKCYTCRKAESGAEFIKIIKDTFKMAAQNTPSIVFLDDMDKFSNVDIDHCDSEEYVTVQTCIDEVKDKEVFVVATANEIFNMPWSLKRAGRFDRIFEINPPAVGDAAQIIQNCLAGKNVADDVDPVIIARLLEHRSCAQLETVINEAGLYAGFNRYDKITMEHIVDACMRVVFEIPVKELSAGDEDWYEKLPDGSCTSTQIVYHEAGHAVVSEIINPGSVTLISAYGGPNCRGGFTAYYQSEETSPMTWRKGRIISALGGAAAVEHKFGISDCGNASDINTAHNMISDLVGDDCMCGFAFYMPPGEESDGLKQARENVIIAELEKYYRKSKEIIAANTKFFETVAAELAVKKVLTAEDIANIKSDCDIKAVSF